MNNLIDQNRPSQEIILNLFNTFNKGNFKNTEELGLSIISQFPNFEFAWKLLGVLYLQNNFISKALEFNMKLIDLSPNDPEANFNLALSLQKNKQLKESVLRYRNAISLKPDYYDANNNLGTALKELGNIEESNKFYRNAISIDPNKVEAYNNLGNSLRENNEYKDAIIFLKKAILINSKYAPAFNNLGLALKETGDYQEAEKVLRKAILLNPNSFEAKLNWCDLMNGIIFFKPMPEINILICNLLDSRNIVRARKLAKTSISLIKNDPIFLDISKRILKNPISINNIVDDICKLSLLVKFMVQSTITDIQIENLLKTIRYEILKNILEIKKNDNLKKFITSLSQHCFLNEYLYGETPDERNILNRLEISIEKNLANNINLDIIELACLASYRPLKNYKWIDKISNNPEYDEILQIQIFDLKKEQELSKNIPTLNKIKDPISSKVMDQYEANPYPRWFSLSKFLNSKSIKEMTNDLNLKIVDKQIHTVDKPKILIAGCGTGQHSIETASRFKDCEVLAIDLSLPSLSYAKRMSEKFSIDNIKYMQADILDLNMLNSKFDIIESVGVLHHMLDPIAGWKILVDNLNSGGLIKIGLYSKYARKHISNIRNEILGPKQGYNNYELIEYRNNLIKSNLEYNSKIFLSSDFYSLSEFRDLLFHVQEHTFTLEEIIKHLETMNLNFCGFENDRPLRLYKKEHIEYDNLYNLNLWKDFEIKNPDIFTGMYQFWCQKI